MIKRLFPYLRGYQRQAVLAPTLVALETICELILPLLMAEIIDNGIANSNMPVILKMGALMLVVAGISMYCGVMSSKHASFAAQGLGANLRQAEFERLNAFSFADIDRFSSASLITRMTNDVTNIQNVVALSLRLLVRSGVMLVASLAVAITHPSGGWPDPADRYSHPRGLYRRADEGVYGSVPEHAEPDRRPE